MSDVMNDISRELLCTLSNTLPIDPVLCQDGLVYERDALEALRKQSKPYSVPLISQTPFHSKLKSIIEKLVSSGKIDDEYLGDWTEKKQASSESATIENALDGATEEEDPRRMVELGEMYLKGEVVGRNEVQAYAHFERASSENDDEIGTIRKADCLLTGTGVTKDFQDGYQTLIEAAQMEKSVHATLRLIYFYEEGILGFKQDEEARAKWEEHMKKISPQTSDAMLEEMMSALKESLNNLAVIDQTTDIENEETDSYSTEDYESDNSTVNEDEASQMSTTRIPKTPIKSDCDEKVSEEKLKECVTCKTSKPQTDFTASQWKKNADTIKCSACVSKLPAFQTPTLKKKKCCSCGVSKAFESFSFNQWRKREHTGKCSNCVKKGTLDHILVSSL